MAKLKKRKSINSGVSADDFLGKSTLPASRHGGMDNITVGLSIEEIQESTKNLVLFKNINSKQLMAVTENNQKRAMFLSHLHQWKENAGWIAGKLLFEIQKSIEDDFNKWSSTGEREDNKPEFTTFKHWIETYNNDLGFGISTAKEYLWIYKNVEFDKASLGFKKQKLIQQIKDPVLREKLESTAINENLTVQGLEERIEKIKESEKSKKEKDLLLSKMKFNISNNEGKYVIECKKEDSPFIIKAIQKFEDQIKLYAQRLKGRDDS